TVSANLLLPKKAEIEKAAGFELQIVGNGSGRGLADLIEGKVKVAMISAPLADEVKSLKAKGVAVDGAELKGCPVGGEIGRGGGGGSTVSANLLLPKKAEIEKAAGFELQIVGNGSGRGLADLIEGKVKVAMISAPLADEVKSLKAKGVAVDEAKLKAYPVGS